MISNYVAIYKASRKVNLTRANNKGIIYRPSATFNSTPRLVKK